MTATRATMIKRLIIASILIWAFCALGRLTIIYRNIYLSHIEAEEQLNKQQLEQERINKLTVEEILKEIPPKYGVKSETVKKIAHCESTLNPKAINYNDGGPGKHSVGILQFQKITFDGYSKKMGEDLDYYSTYDQAKVASYMISKGQIHQWSCSRILGMV